MQTIVSTKAVMRRMSRRTPLRRARVADECRSERVVPHQFPTEHEVSSFLLESPANFEGRRIAARRSVSDKNPDNQA